MLKFTLKLISVLILAFACNREFPLQEPCKLKIHITDKALPLLNKGWDAGVFLFFLK